MMPREGLQTMNESDWEISDRMSINFMILWKIIDSLNDSVNERYEQMHITRKIEKFPLHSRELNKN